MMTYQILNEAWTALRRNRTRSALTMLGIVWGIATVTLLIAYGGSFREILVGGFNAFGKGAIIAWPQQTSEQLGGQRAGKKVVLEQADLDMIKETANFVRHACLETVRRPGIAYGDRMAGTAPVRGVCARNMATCATKCLPKVAGSIPSTNWSAAASSSSALAFVNNCLPGVPPSVKQSSSRACASPSLALWTGRSN
jgi:hypothetical protein